MKVTTEREEIKTLIESAEDVNQADETVKKSLGGNPSLEEKISFLCEQFGVEIVGQSETPDYDKYYNVILSSIINAKYDA